MSRLFSFVVLLIYIYVCNKNLKNGYWFGVCFLLSFPISPYTNSLDYVTLVSFGSVGINLFHVIPIVFLIFTLLKNKSIIIIKGYYGVFIGGLGALYILGILWSLKNGYSFLQDFQKFFIALIWIYNTNYILEAKDIILFIKKIVFCVFFNVIFSILMHWFGKYIPGLIRDDISGQYSNMYLSSMLNVYFIAIIFIFVLIVYKERIRVPKYYYITLIMSVSYMFLLSQNRTIILICILAMIVMFCHSIFHTINRNALKKWGNIIFVAICGMVVMFFRLRNAQSEILGKFINMISSANILIDKNDSVYTRINTIIYYMKEIIKNPLGYGYGKALPLINQFGRFHGEDSLYTDNALINIGIKCGIVAMLIFTFVILYPIINNSVKNDMLIWSAKLIYILFVFATVIMTTQAINNYQVIIVFWMLNILLYKIKKDKKSDLGEGL